MKMERRKTFASALSGVLVGGLMLTGGLAFAGDTDNSVSNNLAGKIPFLGQAMKHRGEMAFGKGDFMAEQHQQQISDSLKSLVEKGTITLEQSDKILKQFEDAKKDREALAQKMENMTLKEIRQYMQDNQRKPQNPINQLVSDGVISQEQADAFQATMKETAQKQKRQQISDGLKALVEKKTITQEQAAKILKQLEAAQKDREALFEKAKDMTPEERRQYMRNNKGKFQNPISQLVEDGTITQEQAKAIRDIFPHKGFKGGMLKRKF